ncbi:MAG: DNA translocase FtsK 4TM domain-containing protein [Gammaproteobacteria bacterium]|nr:DNA translocase FtsK 4TM domain-containing protein [Gammaproteobacteria bacterium]MBU2057907.1 DNA translocase FtsK 4TM domain-containing protein [Gammaproteobacteria bacterium]MBU2174259.1 DNA translocase FtsK 4TM domain-containing protein [Gammaproteobacteria bacterium]MBU2247791.1 DNA translocase FtsK 4TM domain-containing protein [Gammaproteobacteria bacterium]MBU2344316.1 DNA translocase FtsK 4TM domain-containing protein [Gammaproteobacteria bacterium]
MGLVVLSEARRLRARLLFSLNGMQRLSEVGLILSFGLAAFMLLALMSFDPADPSWSQAGYQTAVHNYAGPKGAWIADILLFTFGWIAYLVPPLVAFIGYLLTRRAKALMEMDFLILGMRLIGLVLTILCASAISSINFNDIFYFSSGGVVGDVVSAMLMPNFNFIGTILLLLCGLSTGLTLATGISWVTVADELGALTMRLLVALYQAPTRLGHYLAQRSAAKAASPLSFQTESTVPQQRREPEMDTEMSRLTHTEPAVAPEIIRISPVRNEATESAFVAPEEEQIPLPEIEEVQTQPSRAYFPGAERVEPLPFAPLDEKTEAVAFVSVDTLADDDLSFSAVDDAYYPEQLQHLEQSFAEVERQAVVEPVMIDEEEDDTLDSAHFSPDELPSLALLDRPDKATNPIDPADLERVSRLVEAKLLDFGVDAKVVAVLPGPVVTRFELDLAPGVKVSKITGLSKDLARSLSAISVRVVEVIPGKSYIGLELPNQFREIVRLSEVIGDEIFIQSKSPLTMVLGKDIAGKSVVADLGRMPHLLVAGTTGSGKSVGVNVMICSLLYKSTPEDVRFLMIDPKMLELSVYEGIPHLLTEVVTDMKEAANGLRWCVGEMERRYKLMSALGVRNLKGYNQKIQDAIAAGTPIRDPIWKPSDNMMTMPPELEKLPSIVVVIDEFADMMMIVGKKVEELIARIAQKARAAGIHLILATQRPSVDVITGLIKANIPTRMAFQVSSKIDSRTILDQQGAESLLGQGDMLYLPPGSGVPTRVHGAFVDDHEVHAVVSDWKRRGKPNYISEILNGEPSEDSLLPGESMEGDDAESDPLFDQAVAFVTESRKASVSGVQRRFRIGYNRAARLVEQMEMSGIVSGAGHNGNREVLAPPPPKVF